MPVHIYINMTIHRYLHNTYIYKYRYIYICIYIINRESNERRDRRQSIDSPKRERILSAKDARPQSPLDDDIVSPRGVYDFRLFVWSFSFTYALLAGLPSRVEDRFLSIPTRFVICLSKHHHHDFRSSLPENLSEFALPGVVLPEAVPSASSSLQQVRVRVIHHIICILLYM
jgi:hypothetical protein